MQKYEINAVIKLLTWEDLTLVNEDSPFKLAAFLLGKNKKIDVNEVMDNRRIIHALLYAQQPRLMPIYFLFMLTGEMFDNALVKILNRLPPFMEFMTYSEWDKKISCYIEPKPIKGELPWKI